MRSRFRTAAVAFGSSREPPAATADGSDQVDARDLFEEVAGGACHDRAEEGFVVGVRGEHQAGGWWCDG